MGSSGDQTRRTGVVETKGRREERRRKEEKRGKWAEKERGNKKKEKAKKGEDNGGKESSRGMGNLGQGKRSSKIRRRSKEVGTKTFSLVDLSLWKETEWEDANTKVIGPCNWDQGRVHAKKEKNVSIFKGGERGGVWVHTRTIEKRIY